MQDFSDRLQLSALADKLRDAANEMDPNPFRRFYIAEVFEKYDHKFAIAMNQVSHPESKTTCITQTIIAPCPQAADDLVRAIRNTPEYKGEVDAIRRDFHTLPNNIIVIIDNT